MKQIRAGLNSRAKQAAPHKRAAVYASELADVKGAVCKVLSSSPVEFRSPRGFRAAVSAAGHTEFFYSPPLTSGDRVHKLRAVS